MASPEMRLPFIGRTERLSPVDPDIAAIKSLMGYTTPEPLLDILKESDNSILVQDAAIDADTFYGNDTRRYSTTPAFMLPLRVAIPAPSENHVSSDVTAIRLLHQVASIPEFDIDAYGEKVKIGTDALTKRPSETYKEHLEKIKETDSIYPDLDLVTTQAKIMINNVLDPVGLPADLIRLPGTKIGVSAQIAKYEKNLPALMDQNHPWYPKVKKAFQLGKNAILDRDLVIRSQT